MRLTTLLWPFPYLVRLGWLTAGVPDPTPGRGRVYLLRGNAVVFSGGFGTLCGRFRRKGIRAEDLRCVGVREVVREVAATPAGPVALVGHSCGGRYALYAAHDLLRSGVVIDLVVCLDVAGAPPVPGNVRRAVHVYRSRGRLYPARPLRAADGSGAAVENVDLDAPGSPLDPRGISHLNITGNAAVQEFVAGRVLDVMATARAAAPG